MSPIPKPNLSRDARILFLRCLFGLAFCHAAIAETHDEPAVYVQVGHHGGVSDVAFAPYGHLLASAGADETVKIWDTTNGRELRTLVGHADRVVGVRFSPDGSHLITNDPSTVKVWDLKESNASRTIVQSHDGLDDVAVAMFPDGNHAAVSFSGSIRIVDINSGHELRRLSSKKYKIEALEISRDGQRILARGQRLSVQDFEVDLIVWDAQSGRALVTIPSVGDFYITSARFSRDGATVASGRNDGTISLWSAESGQLLRTIAAAASRHSIGSISFSPDGRALLVESDGLLRILDVDSGSELRSLNGYEVFGQASYSDDGQKIAAGTKEGIIQIWSASGSQRTQTLEGRLRTYGAKAVAFSPDGHTLASSNYDSSIVLWGLDGSADRLLSREPSRVNGLAFSPDGRVLLSFSFEGLKFWDVPSGAVVRVIGDRSADHHGLAFSPDGSKVAAGFGNVVKLFDAHTGDRLLTLDAHAGRTTVLAFSPDGWTLAFGDDDQTVTLWDLKSGRNIRSFRQKGEWRGITALSYVHDGSELAIANSDAVALWDTNSGRLLQKFESSANTSTLASSSDGRTLAAGIDSVDVPIKLWDVVLRRALPIEIQLRSVDSLAFSPDGSLLAVASGTDGVKILAVKTRSELATLFSFLDGSLKVTPQGYYDYRGKTVEDAINVRVGESVIGIGSLRERFYRPDVVARTLSTASLPQGVTALQLTDRAPSVALVNLPARVASKSLLMNIKVEDNGGGVGDIRIYVNGAAVSQTGSRHLGVDTPQGPNDRVVPVQLTSGENELKVIAFNADGSVHSDPVARHVYADFVPEHRPELYALIVGINEFENPALQLKYAVADATAVADTLAKKARLLFNKVHVRLLVTKGDTTKEFLSATLSEYRALLSEDVFLFYVASHGTVVGEDLKTRQYYLIPSNVGLTDDASLRIDGIGQQQMLELLANIPATKKLLLFDTCSSGALGLQLDFPHERTIDDSAAVKLLSEAVGSTIISASTSQGIALEGINGHGLFTWVLLEGLQGKADARATGYVSTIDLAGYIGDELPRVAEQEFRVKQYPTLHTAGQPFPIARSR